MGNTNNVMQRFELKYIINAKQLEELKESIASKMKIDEYGLTSIASLYYDTPDFRLIRKSQDNSPYKEKIRLRSYGIAKKDSPVFLELKRKANGIVYKRRIQSTIDNVNMFFNNEINNIQNNSQIGKEITYFRDFYKQLIPSCLIIYDRCAYNDEEGNVRLTIDHNPRYRFNNLNLTTNMDGISLLNDGYAILEIKVQGSIPLWLTKILDKSKIYKNTFSKYGEAYKKAINNIERRDEIWKTYFNQFTQVQSL